MTTITDLQANVRTGVTERILHQLETSPTIGVREATKKAAWLNLCDARDAGWTQHAQDALIQTYLIVGTHIAAEAIRNAK